MFNTLVRGAVVEDIPKLLYESFMKDAKYASDAITSESAINAANKVSALDPVESNN